MRYLWNPWQDVRQLQREMNDLFERRGGREESALERGWAPAVDIYEDPEGFLLTAELPGLDPAKVELTVEDNNLTLRGTRELEYPDSRENYHRLEREYGAFARTFSLPATVDASGIDAEFKQGLLRVRIPKRGEVQPKQISVKVSE